VSTRAQLGFYESKDAKLEDWKALVYVHSDGNPEVISSSIVPFLQAWKRGLGDSEYLSARLLQYLCNQFDEMMKDAPAYKGILGFGISKGFRTDIAYYYRIDPNGVRVYAVNFDDDGKPDFKLVQTVEPLYGVEFDAARAAEPPLIAEGVQSIWKNRQTNATWVWSSCQTP
jgi:hypothetical protein